MRSLDRTLHTQQADPVLIFHQLADRTHPAVAQVVDVVDLAFAVLQLAQQDLEDLQDVLTCAGCASESSVSKPRREFILTRPTEERS